MDSMLLRFFTSKIIENVENRVKRVTKVRLGFKVPISMVPTFFFLVLSPVPFHSPQLRPAFDFLQLFLSPSTIPLILSPWQPEWPSQRLNPCYVSVVNAQMAPQALRWSTNPFGQKRVLLKSSVSFLISGTCTLVILKSSRRWHFEGVWKKSSDIWKSTN